MTRPELETLVKGLYFDAGVARWGGYKFEIHKVGGEMLVGRVTHEESGYAMSGSVFKTWDEALGDLMDMFGMLRSFRMEN